MSPGGEEAQATQVVVTGHGGPDRLRVRPAPIPRPGPGELLIEVRAAGVNFADILIRQGIYPGAPRPPCVVGHEISGVVDGVGENVDPVWIGREVLALTDYGGYSTHHVLDANRVLLKPDGLDFDLAAALPLNYVTAWLMLIVMGSLRADQTLLIQNAGGGVGIAAIDIARHVGARILGTSSPGKHEFLAGRGLDHPIDYRQGDWPAEVMEITRGQGVDLVMDPLGPASWRRSLSLLGPGGRLGMFGISEAAAPGIRGKLGLASAMIRAPLFHPAKLIRGNRGVFGCNIHQMYGARGKLNTWLGAVLRGVGQGWVRPHVDSRFPLEDAPRAHEHIEARRNIGKVILNPARTRPDDPGP